MAEIPATLFGFTTFVDGKGYAARVSRGTPPKPTRRSSTSAPACPTPPPVPRPREDRVRLHAARVQRRHHPPDERLRHKRPSVPACPLGRRGLYADGRDENREWEAGSQFTEADFGDITSKEPETEAKFMMACSRVKLRIGGSNIWAGVRAILEA